MDWRTCSIILILAIALPPLPTGTFNAYAGPVLTQYSSTSTKGIRRGTTNAQREAAAKRNAARQEAARRAAAEAAKQKGGAHE